MNNSDRPYEMGKMPPDWKGGKAKLITFIVTEDCNLICKYCYLTGKNHINKMDFETAKKAIDVILNSKDICDEYDAVIWDFIGGEPFLEVDLIDNICEYIKLQTYITNHKWFDLYRFNLSSNGILYNDPKVQKFITKNYSHLSIGITIDGTRKKHDLNRIYKDGRGSYDDVIKNLKLWQNQFPSSLTKVTFASQDLIYLKDSIIHLWDLGLKNVPANVVFEDVWKEGDDIIFENQLRELADYILQNDLWKDHNVRFFDEALGHPLDDESLSSNFCGAGKMLAIDYKGDFFPCLRFADYSLSNKKSWKIGDSSSGINQDKVRPFLALNVPVQSPEECLTCKVASGCAWCQGCNYDMADTDTIYQRATYVCKMHKANCRANDYFWTRLKEKTGIMTEYEEIRNIRNKTGTGYYLQFITSDDITPHCNYTAKSNSSNINVMSDEILEKGIRFADKNNMIPVYLTNTIKPGECISGNESIIENIEMPILNNSIIPTNLLSTNCILLLAKDNIENLSKNVQGLFEQNIRINITIKDLENWNNDDLEKYENELKSIVKILFDNYDNYGELGEINVLTDIFNLTSMSNCEAGVKSYSLAPNGKIYICPAFYFDNPENSIGSLEEGIKTNDHELFKLSKAPVCNECDAYHCSRCRYLNKKLTGEYNTPSRIQCLISHIERRNSLNLQVLLDLQCENTLEPIDYMDPLAKICAREKISVCKV